MLSGCAAPRLRTKPAPELPEDLSKPNVASIYYYLCGAQFYHEWDFYFADQLLELATMQDPASPQIRKLRVKASANDYIYSQNEEIAGKVADVLKSNKDLIFGDEELLHLYYTVYDMMDRKEERDAALNKLLRDYPGGKAYLRDYYRSKEDDGKPDLKKLRKAEKHATDTQTRLFIAMEYQYIDPNKAIEILQKLPRSPQTEQRLFRLYLDNGKIKELRQHFLGYELPAEQIEATNYLMFVDNNGRWDIALDHADYILNSDNMEIISMLTVIAYMHDDDHTQRQVFHYLQEGGTLDDEIAKVYNFLLLHGLKHPGTLPFDILTQKVYSIASLSNAVYVSLLHPDYRQGKQNNDKYATGVLAKQFERMPESTIKDFLMANVVGYEEPDLIPAYIFAEELINRGYGGKEDFDVVIENYTNLKDTPAQIRFLRLALGRFPGDAQYQNNLGYLLLEYPEHLDEAERLISQALRKYPDQISYIDSMAWLYYQKEDYSRALKMIAKIEVHPDMPSELLYHIGKIYLANGMEDKAIEAFQQAIETADDEDYAAQAQEALEALKQ